MQYAEKVRVQVLEYPFIIESPTEGQEHFLGDEIRASVKVIDQFSKKVKEISIILDEITEIKLIPIGETDWVGNLPPLSLGTHITHFIAKIDLEGTLIEPGQTITFSVVKDPCEDIRSKVTERVQQWFTGEESRYHYSNYTRVGLNSLISLLNEDTPKGDLCIAKNSKIYFDSEHKGAKIPVVVDGDSGSTPDFYIRVRRYTEGDRTLDSHVNPFFVRKDELELLELLTFLGIFEQKGGEEYSQLSNCLRSVKRDINWVKTRLEKLTGASYALYFQNITQIRSMLEQPSETTFESMLLEFLSSFCADWLVRAKNFLVEQSWKNVSRGLGNISIEPLIFSMNALVSRITSIFGDDLQRLKKLVSESEFPKKKKANECLEKRTLDLIRKLYGDLLTSEESVSRICNSLSGTQSLDYLTNVNINLDKIPGSVRRTRPHPYKRNESIADFVFRCEQFAKWCLNEAKIFEEEKMENIEEKITLWSKILSEWTLFETIFDKIIQSREELEKEEQNKIKQLEDVCDLLKSVEVGSLDELLKDMKTLVQIIENFKETIDALKAIQVELALYSIYERKLSQTNPPSAKIEAKQIFKSVTKIQQILNELNSEILKNTENSKSTIEEAKQEFQKIISKK